MTNSAEKGSGRSFDAKSSAPTPVPSTPRSAGSQHERIRWELSKPVFFIGFMGAGKSSVARRLARKCGVASVDMDAYIERHESKSVSDIFAAVGEEGFRKIETQVLKDLAHNGYPMLISCGGGILTQDANKDVLKESGYVIHLVVDADEASKRISDKSTRPLFNDIESARKRQAERMPAYNEAADVCVLTHGKSVARIASEVQNILEREGILCRQRK